MGSHVRLDMGKVRASLVERSVRSYSFDLSEGRTAR